MMEGAWTKLGWPQLVKHLYVNYTRLGESCADPVPEWLCIVSEIQISSPMASLTGQDGGKEGHANTGNCILGSWLWLQILFFLLTCLYDFYLAWPCPENILGFFFFFFLSSIARTIQSPLSQTNSIFSTLAGAATWSSSWPVSSFGNSGQTNIEIYRDILNFLVKIICNLVDRMF